MWVKSHHFILAEFRSINLKHVEEYYKTKNIVSQLLNRIYVTCGIKTGKDINVAVR
jgi:hypothetical protein